MTNLDSKAISLLRFPLCVGVVCIHSAMLGGGNVQHILGDEIGCISVPLFLLISGFLFFREGDGLLTKEVWLGKLKKRVRSLVIPYLLWNLIAYAIYAVRFGFSISDFFHSFWVIDIPGRTGSSPMDGPLWYVRNLMVMILLSPIISMMLKYTKWYLLTIMALLWVLQIVPFSKGIGIAFFFFSLGGYLRMKGWHMELMRYKAIAIGLYLAYLVATLYVHDFPFGFIHQIGLVLGIYAYVSVAFFFARQGRGNGKCFKHLSELSFFIYCLHDILLQFLKPLLENSLGGGDMVYIVLVVLDVMSCLAIYHILKLLSPRFVSVLQGGR